MSSRPESEVAQRARRTVAAWLEGESIDWMLVCGSGMGAALVGDGDGSLGLEIDRTIQLRALDLPSPAVAGHGNALVLGTLGERRICVQTGRLHPYEGHDMQVVTAPLDAVLAHGARGVALTCAVGGIDPSLAAGSVVSLRDQINLFGPTPLVGPRFIDCANVYDKQLRGRVQGHASELGQDVPEAVYAHARGPQYETPAEVEALRRLGGEVVGMSTTYEAILAAAHEVPCFGLGIVTNAAGAEGLSHQEVQELAAQARGRLSALLAKMLAAEPHPQGDAQGE